MVRVDVRPDTLVPLADHTTTRWARWEEWIVKRLWRTGRVLSIQSSQGVQSASQRLKRMTRYHLWVMPSGSTYERLARTISELSTQYRAPCFEPHVTVLGNLPGSQDEIIARASRLGRLLQPHEVQLTQPGFGSRYFQCIFLHVQPSRALEEAHRSARSIFGVRRREAYRPHLSLLYGHVPRDVKAQIVGTLPPRLAVRFTVRRLEVIRAESDDPADWFRVGSIALAAKRRPRVSKRSGSSISRKRA